MTTPHLGVMLGLGAWLGAIGSLVAPYVSTAPEVLHWLPLGLCLVGFVSGYFFANKLGTKL